ncbi:hypothetical protein NSQ54_14465 [Alkalihalobacillus sp. FSL W8-0930]
MKQRYFICLLLAGVLISYGIQYLPLGESGVKGWFALSWLVFAGIVLLSNLMAWVRANTKNQTQKQTQRETVPTRVRQNDYE